MIKIAVVEDEEFYISQILQYLEKYQGEEKEEFRIKVYRDGDGITVDYKAQYDIILMDIQMKFMDGMTAAEEIRKVDSEVVIIFITNVSQYAIRGMRDNMAIYKEQMVLRELDYCIIDEVDSVLIDEARTPLIISGQSGKSTKLYEVCDVLARQLVRGEESGETPARTTAPST